MPSTDTFRRLPRERNGPRTSNIPRFRASVKTRFTIFGLTTAAGMRHRAARAARRGHATGAREARPRAGRSPNGPRAPGAPSGGGGRGAQGRTQQGAPGRACEPKQRGTQNPEKRSKRGRPRAQPKGPGADRPPPSGPQARAGPRAGAARRGAQRRGNPPKQREAPGGPGAGTRSAKPRRSAARATTGSPQRSDGKAKRSGPSERPRSRTAAHTGRAGEPGGRGEGGATARGRAAPKRTRAGAGAPAQQRTRSGQKAGRRHAGAHTADCDGAQRRSKAARVGPLWGPGPRAAGPAMMTAAAVMGRRSLVCRGERPCASRGARLRGGSAPAPYT